MTTPYVTIRMVDLKPGDRFRIWSGTYNAKAAPSHDDRFNFVDVEESGGPIFFSEVGECELLMSSRLDVAKRVADMLEGFAPEVRLHAFRFFCPTCGVRACKQHQ